jgi:hypothetical protein
MKAIYTDNGEFVLHPGPHGYLVIDVIEERTAGPDRVYAHRVSLLLSR